MIYKSVSMPITTLRRLNLPATSCGNIRLLRKFLFFIRSLNPLQAAVYVLAVQFMMHLNCAHLSPSMDASYTIA